MSNRRSLSGALSALSLLLAAVVLLLWVRSYPLGYPVGARAPWRLSDEPDTKWVHLFRGHLYSNVIIRADQRALSLPLSCILLLFLVYPISWCSGRFLLRAKRRHKGLCIACGYPAEGLQGDRCPECGSHRLVSTIAALPTWPEAIREQLIGLWHKIVGRWMLWALPERWPLPGAIAIFVVAGLSATALATWLSVSSTIFFGALAFNARQSLLTGTICAPGLPNGRQTGLYWPSVGVVPHVDTPFLSTLVVSVFLVCLGFVITIISVGLTLGFRGAHWGEVFNAWAVLALLSGPLLVGVTLIYGLGHVFLVESGAMQVSSDSGEASSGGFDVLVWAHVFYYFGCPIFIARYRKSCDSRSARPAIDTLVADARVIGIS